jgi:hypothetical protein
MRVLITGSRNFKDRDAMVAALEGYDDDTVIVHGGARGADRLAHDVAFAMGYSIALFSADWNKHGKAAGPLRNQAMVDAGADVCLAFPLPGSKGTWDCVKRALRADIPVDVIKKED